MTPQNKEKSPNFYILVLIINHEYKVIIKDLCFISTWPSTWSPLWLYEKIQVKKTARLSFKQSVCPLIHISSHTDSRGLLVAMGSISWPLSTFVWAYHCFVFFQFLEQKERVHLIQGWVCLQLFQVPCRRRLLEANPTRMKNREIGMSSISRRSSKNLGLEEAAVDL